MKRITGLEEKYKHFTQKFEKYYQVYFTVIAVPIFVGFLVQGVFLLLFRLSPWVSILGVLIAFFLLWGSYKLISGVLRTYKDMANTSLRREVDFLILGYFGVIGVLSVFALSCLSYLLFHFHVLQYIDETSKEIESVENFETFTGLYSWYLVDNIPGVDVESFNWKRSITPDNFLSKVFVLIFQLFITFIFLVSIKQWWDNRKLNSVSNKVDSIENGE